MRTLQCTESLSFICFAHKNIIISHPKKDTYFSKFEKKNPLLPWLPKWPKTANPFYEFGSWSISVLIISVVGLHQYQMAYIIILHLLKQATADWILSQDRFTS